MADEEVVYTISVQDLASGKVKALSGETEKLNENLRTTNDLGKLLQKTFGLVFAVATAKRFYNAMMDTGRAMASVKIELTSALKDTAAAQDVVNNAMRESRELKGFDYRSILEANAALISVGDSADKARSVIHDLSIAVKATGRGQDAMEMLAQRMRNIRVEGKATIGDIQAFGAAGINVYQLLADYTKQPLERTKDMVITYRLLTNALHNATQASGSLAAGLNATGNAAAEASAQARSSFIEMLDKLYQAWEPIYIAMVNGVRHVADAFVAMAEWIERNKEALIALTGGVITAVAILAGLALAANASAIATWAATAATWAVTAATAAWNAVVNMSPLGWLLTILSLVSAAVIYLWRNVKEFRAGLVGVWYAIKEWGSSVMDLFKAVGKTIMGVLTFNPKMIAEGLSDSINVIANTGNRMGRAFKEGFNQGMADYEKDHQTTATPHTVVNQKTTVKEKGDEVTYKNTSKASGQKVVTINIKIDNVIRDFSIKTTTIQESAARVKDIVAQALLSAVNDSQIIAGQ